MGAVKYRERNAIPEKEKAFLEDTVNEISNIWGWLKKSAQKTVERDLESPYSTLRGVGEAGEAISSVTDAPLRAGVTALRKGASAKEALGKAYQQVKHAYTEGGILPEIEEWGELDAAEMERRGIPAEYAQQGKELKSILGDVALSGGGPLLEAGAGKAAMKLVKEGEKAGRAIVKGQRKFLEESAKGFEGGLQAGAIKRKPKSVLEEDLLDPVESAGRENEEAITEGGEALKERVGIHEEAPESAFGGDKWVEKLKSVLRKKADAPKNVWTRMKEGEFNIDHFEVKPGKEYADVKEAILDVYEKLDDEVVSLAEKEGRKVTLTGKTVPPELEGIRHPGAPYMSWDEGQSILEGPEQVRGIKERILEGDTQIPLTLERETFRNAEDPLLEAERVYSDVADDLKKGFFTDAEGRKFYVASRDKVGPKEIPGPRLNNASIIEERILAGEPAPLDHPRKTYKATRYEDTGELLDDPVRDMGKKLADDMGNPQGIDRFGKDTGERSFHVIKRKGRGGGSAMRKAERDEEYMAFLDRKNASDIETKTTILDDEGEAVAVKVNKKRPGRGIWTDEEVYEINDKGSSEDSIYAPERLPEGHRWRSELADLENDIDDTRMAKALGLDLETFRAKRLEWNTADSLMEEAEITDALLKEGKLKGDEAKKARQSIKKAEKLAKEAKDAKDIMKGTKVLERRWADERYLSRDAAEQLLDEHRKELDVGPPKDRKKERAEGVQRVKDRLAAKGVPEDLISELVSKGSDGVKKLRHMINRMAYGDKTRWEKFFAYGGGYDDLKKINSKADLAAFIRLAESKGARLPNAGGKSSAPARPANTERTRTRAPEPANAAGSSNKLISGKSRVDIERKASAVGVTPAEYNEALDYWSGKGVPEDIAEKIFQKEEYIKLLKEKISYGTKGDWEKFFGKGGGPEDMKKLKGKDDLQKFIKGNKLI